MKKIIAAFIALAILAVAIPTFAAMKEVKCPICYGLGRCQTCQGRGYFVAYNWKRDEKGRQVRVPPYQRRCHICYGSGRCKNCQGTGKRKIYIP